MIWSTSRQLVSTPFDPSIAFRPPGYTSVSLW